MTGARYLRFLSSVEMTLRADAERRLGGAGRGRAAHHRVRRQRRDLGREGLRWRGWFGIDSTAMERAELPERERLSLAEQFGVPIEEVPHDHGAYLHFIKEKGAEIYYNTTMALLCPPCRF